MRTSLRALARRVGSPRLRRLRSALAVVVVAIGGAWLGLLLVAHISAPVGPVDVRFAVRPTVFGNTTVDIAPLGTLTLDSHDGPLQLVATVERVRPEAVERIIADPRILSGLADVIVRDVRAAMTNLIMKSAMAAVLGAAVLGLAVFRRPSRAGWTVLTCCALITASIGVGAATFNPRSVAEPRYTGLLASAPSVVGSAESIVHNFSMYSDQLAQLVTNVSRLYEATSTLPVYKPDPTTVRVLHVSDLHLNPAAWSVIRSISEQFHVNAIVDSGDITDNGTKAENEYVDEISSLDVPYIFVRGNHDSQTTQEAVADEDNAVVLDGEVREVAGLRFFGAGDPRYTPDEKTRESPASAALRVAGQRVAKELRSSEPPPVDVAVIHDPTVGRALDGYVPLILSGHAHRRSMQTLPHGTQLFVQGSTGAAGIRTLEREEPTPIMCTVLYFDRETGRLQARDDITIGGLGLASAQIQRTLVPNPNHPITSPASPSPTPSGSPSRSGTPVGAPSPQPTVSPTADRTGGP